MFSTLSNRSGRAGPPTIVLAVALLLSGCAFTDPAPTPTFTAAPATSTPTVTTTATPTPSPTMVAVSQAPTPSPTASSTSTPTPLARLQRGDSLPTATPTPTGGTTSGIACVVNSVSASHLNLREGPGLDYRIIDSLPASTPLSALKCTPEGDWLLVETAGMQVGWVNAAFVSCRRDLSGLPCATGVAAAPQPPSPIPTATLPPEDVVATPSATPPPAPPVGYWRGEYYSNASLLGQPVLIRNDPELAFNWILDSPAPGIPSDNFSVRWTRAFDFAEGGDYRFFANADDGIRVYVDGWPVIEAWHTVIPVDYMGEFRAIQPGLHTVTVEYFESGGHAHVRVWSEKGTFVDDDWYGEYFANSDLQGQPLFTRNDDEIDFDWGHDSPDSRLSTNKFSIRWTRTVHFEFGDYKFFASVEEDDWVKVSIDGWTVIEEYVDNDETLSGYFANMGGGNHTVVVEYQEHRDKARIKFRWDRQ